MIFFHKDMNLIQTTFLHCSLSRVTFKLLRLRLFFIGLGRQIQVHMATDCIMTCTCKGFVKQRAIQRNLPDVTKTFWFTQRGASPCFFTQSKKTNRSCCFACGSCLSVTHTHKKRKPREQEGSVTLSFPHSEVFGWFRSLCNQRTCSL